MIIKNKKTEILKIQIILIRFILDKKWIRKNKIREKFVNTIYNKNSYFGLEPIKTSEFC